MLGFPAGFIYCLSGIFISGHSTSHIFRHFNCNLYQNSIHIRHLQQSQEQTFNDLSNSTTRIHSAVKPFISPQVQNNPEQRLLMYSSKILKFITDNTLSQHFVHDNITLKILSDSTLGNTTNCKVKGGQSATQINLIINYPRLSQVSVSEKKVKYTTQIQKCNFFFFHLNQSLTCILSFLLSATIQLPASSQAIPEGSNSSPGPDPLSPRILCSSPFKLVIYKQLDPAETTDQIKFSHIQAFNETPVS